MKSLKVLRLLVFSLFVLASAGNLVSQFVVGHVLAVYTKPLIVPSLALFCWLLFRESDVRGRRVATLMLTYILAQTLIAVSLTLVEIKK